MDGLHPQSIYHYRFHLSDGTVSGGAFFSTAPAREIGYRAPVAEPFTFTAFADVGTDTAPTDPKYAWGQDPTACPART